MSRRSWRTDNGRLEGPYGVPAQYLTDAEKAQIDCGFTGHDWTENDSWNGGVAPYPILQCVKCNATRDVFSEPIVFETAPPSPEPDGMWECNCGCQVCVMSGPHEDDGHEPDPIWVARDSPDWPWR